MKVRPNYDGSPNPKLVEVVTPIPKLSGKKFAKAIVDYIIGIFSAPEVLHNLEPSPASAILHPAKGNR